MNTVDVVAGGVGGIGFMFDQSLAKGAERLTIMPADFIKEAKNAAEEMIGLIADALSDNKNSIFLGVTGDPLRPKLVPPKLVLEQSISSEKVQSGSQGLKQQLASMMLALEQGGVAKLAFNAKSAVARDAVRNTMSSRLVEEYENGLSAVADGLGKLDALKEILSELDQKAKMLKQQLAEAARAMVELDSNSPEYQFAMQACNRLTETLSKVYAYLNGVQSQVLKLQIELHGLQRAVDALLASAMSADVDFPR